LWVRTKSTIIYNKTQGILINRTTSLESLVRNLPNIPSKTAPYLFLKKQQ